MTYHLYPSRELGELRARFGDYEICEFHDHDDRPYLCAVLKPARMDTGLPVLLTATTVPGLTDQLHRSRDDALTARLRDAIYELRDRGLLPDWRPPAGTPPTEEPHTGPPDR